MQKIEYTKMFELEDSHFWFIGKRYFIDSVLSNYSQKIQNILDLGSGTGGLTKFLEKYGIVIGVEKFSYAADLAKKRGVRVLQKDIQKIRFKNKHFDLITILDVLYHKNVQDESLAIDTANKHLKKGGYLLVTDSALPFLKSRHDSAVHGKRRYTIKALSTLIENSGFKILKASYIYFSIFPLVLIDRFIIGSLSKRKGSDVKNVSFLINNILKLLLKLESFLLKFISFPIGSSVIILAEKI